MDAEESAVPQSNEYLLAVLERMRRRLLDQTRRNRLLNYKESARDVAIVDEMPDQVYEHLVTNEKAFYFDHYEPPAQPEIEGQEPCRTLPNSARRGETVERRHTDARLQTPFLERDLERRLRRLYLDHRTIIEETGANNLYLAIGYLRWSVSPDDELPMRSPLVLIPVRLERERSHGEATYRLEFDDEAIDTNYSLAEKLRHDFDISLPTLGEQQPPEDYWGSVESAIARRAAEGWCVLREMSLGLFRFHKQAMWHDLEPSRWPKHSPLEDKDVLSRVLVGSENGDGGPGQFVHDYGDDDDQEKGAVSNLPLVLDADSSQFAALVDALGSSDALVVEGPPGTGKSQTISNLIAAAMSQGLSVLFVAEKMAALEVVAARLRDAGLDPFCLELHGLSSTKKELLHSVMTRLNHRPNKPKGINQTFGELSETKQRLIEISRKLNQPVGPEAIPLHSTPWRHEVLRAQLPDDFDPVELGGVNGLSATEFTLIRNQLDDLSREWSEIPESARQAWRGFRPTQYAEADSPRLATTVSALAPIVEETLNWLNSRDAWEDIPSLYETDRLLQLAGIPKEEAMPRLPVDTDLTCLHRAIHEDRATELRVLLREISEFLENVSKVNEVFDYQNERSGQWAETIKSHVCQLVGTVCDSELSVAELRDELRKIAEAIAGLESFPAFAKPVVDLTRDIPRTLDDYRDLAGEAARLSSGPARLATCAIREHARASAKDYLAEARQRSCELESEAASLELFALDRATDTEEISWAHLRLREHVGRPLAILNKDYRRAKKVIRSLLAAGAKYARTPEFVGNVDRLHKFCRERDAFREDEDLKARLGRLFTGLESEWKTLEEIITFAQALRAELGQESAEAVLGDWSDHVDRLTEAGGCITSTLGLLQAYETQHPFPAALWQRPVAEIARTLSPWRDRLAAAVDALSGEWCNTTVTLEHALRAVDDRQVAAMQESRICQREYFDSLIGHRWEGASTNLSSIETTSRWLQGRLAVPGLSLEILRWLVPTADGVNAERWSALMQNARAFGTAVSGQIRGLERFGNVSTADWLGGNSATLATLQEKLSTCIETLASVSLLSRWSVTAAEIEARELGQFVELVAREKLAGQECRRAYEYSVYDQILARYLGDDSELASLATAKLENLRKRFADLDTQTLALNAARIANDLCRVKIPNGVSSGRVSSYTEAGLLRHEAGKRTRHIPIRQLIKRAGNALQRAKPCFLMSPLSVAQFLPPGEIEFDIVVMDEASQIRPEDALGAIARARKAVIVGDPKQLPPTSFFDTAVPEDDDAEETIVDDTESILDLCLKQFPFRRLRWHYRSQHEALIDFSNQSFYDGDLFVFPSPRGDSRQYGVHLTYIDEPSYKTGRNRAEAEVVVDNIIRHFHRHEDLTLGIAAFNKRQAEEIELLLEKMRGEDPAVDELISRHEGREGLFVKNLENVQGDERDVIFISTTYGPESAGLPVAQRFGPINSDLGWRRLNVIATRARQRVEVFTSLRPTDIRVDQRARRGVRSLRDYLEYAATGRIPDRGELSGRAPDSDFEIAVADLLRNMGYECHPQVGVAGFYIDIGVCHPDRPGEYLMGVECDGAAYHSARSVRDRDRLRQAILESKGWTIHRIWSTSWFHARSAEIERLEAALGKARARDRKLWGDLPGIRPEDEVLASAQRATAAAQDAEREEEAESLEHALERFWRKNISPSFPNRYNSILSQEICLLLARKRPISKPEWFAAVPLELRERIDTRQGEFLDDVLEVVAEYA